MRTRALAGLLLAGCLAGSAGASAPEPDGERARTIFDRTKTTTATYAAYQWYWVRTDDGSPHGGWGAEFHKGKLHRVELPWQRIVADCEAGTGTMFDVTQGTISRGPEHARSACGIDSNEPILGLKWLDRVDGPFGEADRIAVHDARQERIYAVSDSGVLVAAEIFPAAPDARFCLQNEVMAVDLTLPEGDIFSEESLAGSIVPDRYRQAPAAPKGGYWRDGFSCR